MNPTVSSIPQHPREQHLRNMSVCALATTVKLSDSIRVKELTWIYIFMRNKDQFIHKHLRKKKVHKKGTHCILKNLTPQNSLLLSVSNLLLCMLSSTAPACNLGNNSPIC